MAGLETMSTNPANGDDEFEDLKAVDRGSIFADGDAALAPRTPVLAKRTEEG
ncbi:hypothetical protein [Methylobacterium sp. 391_Methyba4]|jgi:hypothetical protein|uniref:hypothetical protein n=1 Tax=Methylobacterium sp. 391_Methyba4 TaxID=3038924 RepID=UPI00241D36E2|nr:hypothetical protein [Methylobacterium sp. 391_Methyba4]WFS09604.1 hypothetical protein P9K36_10075 [Methylobacterium sp. 391_Methyba4]